MTNPISWRPTDDMAAWMARRGADVAASPSLSARTRIEMGLWREAQRIDLARTGWTLAELGIIADVMQAGMAADAVSQMQRIDLARTGWKLVDMGIIAGYTQAGVTSDMVSQLPGGAVTIALHDVTPDGADRAALLSARDKASRLSACATLAMEHSVTQWWLLGLDHTAEAWRSLGIRVVG